MAWQIFAYNLKKVPRKPYPIGQEYKTIADNVTAIIMRLDFCGDPLLRAPAPREGRTIVADSWFGSLKMARELRDNGLYSIMQVAKRAYWPTGMPVADIIETLGADYISYNSMISKDTNENLVAVSFRDLKVKAIIATCGVTTRGKIRRFRNINTGEMVEVVRPKVFDEYEENKSKLKKRIEQ